MKYNIILFVFIMSASVCQAGVQEDISRQKIYKLLEEAYLRDQAPRLIIDSLMRNGVTDGAILLPAITQQREADSINIDLVLPIVDSIYRLGIYDLEPVAYKRCWVIIQHSNNEIQAKYTDFIKQLSKRKLISISSYMAFIDRLHVRQEKAQIYGYQFKRFFNGSLMQFPILEGQKKEWKKLGTKYKRSDLLPSDYTINYKHTLIKRHQFAIIGFIYEGENDSAIEDLVPIANAPIFLNKRKITSTDSTGYFKIVTNKKKLPLSIEVNINGDPVEYKIEQNEDSDFSISIGFFHDMKIWIW